MTLAILAVRTAHFDREIRSIAGYCLGDFLRRRSATRTSQQPQNPSELQAHLDQVPELAVGATDVPPEPAFFDEAELQVKGDRGGVVREHAERELMQAMIARPLD